MKILVAGAGAMGCSFAHKLTQIGQEVFLADAWQENIDKINKDGFNIKDLDITYNVKLPITKMEEFNEKVDLVVLFVKSMYLEQTLQKLEKVLTKDTKVLCLLNGLGHIDTLKKYVSEKNIVIGITLITASLKSMAEASLTAYADTVVSSIVDEGIDNAKEVAELIDKTGLPTKYTDNVKEQIWIKACLNGMYNPICAILDMYLGQLRNIENIQNIIENVINEFHIVAQKEGVNFSKDVARQKLYACIKEGYIGEYHYPSMHQDLRTNFRLTEIDYLNGYISRKAKEYGLSTPYCDLITFQIKALESKLKK